MPQITPDEALDHLVEALNFLEKYWENPPKYDTELIIGILNCRLDNERGVEEWHNTIGCIAEVAAIDKDIFSELHKRVLPSTLKIMII